MPKRLKGIPNLPFPPIVAAMYGAVTGVLIHQTPQWLFEHGVDMSGIARFVPAAAPPLGENARLLAAGGGAAAAFILLWPILSMVQSRFRKMRKKPVVVQRTRGIVVAESMEPPVEFEAPIPGMDAEIRAPIFAGNDLGAPLMSEAALQAGDELMLEEPLDAPVSSMPFAEPAAPETPAAIAVPRAQPQWQIPEPQDYPAPPIQAPLVADTQFRIPGLPDPEEAALPTEPVFDPVSLEEPAHQAASAPAASGIAVDLGFGALSAAAEPDNAIDPFANSQGWNLPAMAADTETERKAAEPSEEQLRISPNFSPGFNPLAIDLGDDEEPAAPQQSAAPQPAMVESAASFVPEPGEIDPFAISFDTGRTEPPAARLPISPVQHAPAQQTPAAAQDDSVQGLMARLNQAMGSRMRPSAPSQGNDGALGLGNLRAI